MKVEVAAKKAELEIKLRILDSDLEQLQSQKCILDRLETIKESVLTSTSFRERRNKHPTFLTSALFCTSEHQFFFVHARAPERSCNVFACTVHMVSSNHLCNTTSAYQIRKRLVHTLCLCRSPLT